MKAFTTHVQPDNVARDIADTGALRQRLPLSNKLNKQQMIIYKIIC